MHPSAWWFRGAAMWEAAKKQEKLKTGYLELYSLYYKYFSTASLVAALWTAYSMGWRVWPVLIKSAASSGCSGQAWAVSFQLPVPSHLLWQQGHCDAVCLVGPWAGRQLQWSSHALGLAIFLPFFLPENNPILSQNGCGPSILGGRSLKWSCLGVWAPLGDLFIPPLEGALQSRHSCPSTQYKYTAIGAKQDLSGEKRFSCHPRLALSTPSFLLVRSHRRNHLTVLCSVLGLYH